MKKLITLALFVFSLGIFVPETASASPATATAVGAPQIRVRIGRRTRYHRNRGRHIGWYNGRRAYWYSYDPRDTRYVRRYYNNNGQRVVRWYWNY